MVNIEQNQDLVHRFREGDTAAAELLFNRYAARLARLAEKHLSDQLAARVDGEDVVQSVFRTFFQRCAKGEFTIDSSAQIWRLLVTLTLRKARRAARRHLAERRSVAAETDQLLDFAQALSQEPGPADAAELVDEIEHILKGLPDLYSHILGKRLEGHSVADIAGNLAVSRQTIYRALELLQHRLEHENVKDSD
jgi:RNA polymerase sigma-70 factor (ECF subfamily)